MDMQKLADTQAIKDVLAKYAVYVDTKNPEGFASVFTEDAVWEWKAAGLRFTGKKALFELADAIAQKLPGVLHMTGNQVIELKGDKASAICSLAVFLSRPEGIYSVMIGNYSDELVKKDGRWFIQHRVVAVENPEIVAEGKIGEYYMPLMDALKPLVT